MSSSDGRWVTINGTHVFIDKNNTVTKGPTKFIGKEVSELSERKASDLIPKNSYVNEEEYKTLESKWASLFKEKDEKWNKYFELKKIAKEESTIKPRSEWTIDDELQSFFEKPRKYNEKGKKALEESNRMYEDSKKVEEQFNSIAKKMNDIRIKEAKKQKANFHPNDLVSTDKKDFEGFNIKSTGTTYGNDYLESHPNQVVSMSPKEYLERSAYEIFNNTIEGTLRGAIQDSSTQKYADMMKSGTKFDLPYLDYNTSSQEGRHRAIAAYVNGIEQIPVLVMGKEVAPPKYPTGVNTPTQKRTYTQAINNGASKSDATRIAKGQESLQDIFKNNI